MSHVRSPSHTLTFMHRNMHVQKQEHSVLVRSVHPFRAAEREFERTEAMLPPRACAASRVV